MIEFANPESSVGWLSETLSTITSKVFTELTIYPYFASVRGWNSVDNVLDRLNLREGVTLVVRRRMREDGFEDMIKTYFPLMWKKGRVVLEVPYPAMEAMR